MKLALKAQLVTLFSSKQGQRFIVLLYVFTADESVTQHQIKNVYTSHKHFTSTVTITVENFTLKKSSAHLKLYRKVRKVYRMSKQMYVIIQAVFLKSHVENLVEHKIYEKFLRN